MAVSSANKFIVSIGGLIDPKIFAKHPVKTFDFCCTCDPYCSDLIKATYPTLRLNHFGVSVINA